MRTHLPESQNRPSRAPRAHSPCWITLNPGRVPFWPTRGARRNLRMRFRLIRAVSTRLAHHATSRVSIWHSVPNRVGTPGAGDARSKPKVPDQIESPWPRRGPRRLDRLFFRTQCK